MTQTAFHGDDVNLTDTASRRFMTNTIALLVLTVLEDDLGYPPDELRNAVHAKIHDAVGAGLENLSTADVVLG